MNPFSEMICINAETAGRKGFREGNVVWMENERGNRRKGVLRIIEGIIRSVSLA